MTDAITGFRTALIRSTYYCAELTEISGISASINTIDATSHDSQGAYEEFLVGMKKGGNITIAANFISGDTNGQIAAVTDFENRTNRAWLICFPNAAGKAWSFSGPVSGYELTSPKDGAMGFRATIQVSGKPTMLTTASTGLTTPFVSVTDNEDNAITLTPVAANDSYEYTCTALTGATGVKITPTATAGVIHVNGGVVVTGNASSAQSIGDAGDITLHTVRVTETSKAPVIYRIWVTRAAA